MPKQWRVGLQAYGEYVSPPPYTFDGFFAPVDMGETNAARVGRSVPVKWRLLDAGGDPVSDPASFAGLMSYPVACDADDGTGTGEVVSGEYAGGSGLQYLGDGYWRFNWKTPDRYAGSCCMMYVEFDNGQTSPEVLFRFK